MPSNTLERSLIVPEVFTPTPYYNPASPSEKFSRTVVDPITGSRTVTDAYALQFSQGRYVAHTAADEDAVRAALRAYGPLAPDRWRGDDRRNEWICKKCGFRTFNENAKDDHEDRHDD